MAKKKASRKGRLSGIQKGKPKSKKPKGWNTKKHGKWRQWDPW